MTRHRPGGGKNHHVGWSGYGWTISWSWDVYYPNSRLRWPRRMVRDTDYPGAVRFAKKWGLPTPEPKCADDLATIAMTEGEKPT